MLVTKAALDALRQPRGMRTVTAAWIGADWEAVNAHGQSTQQRYWGRQARLDLQPHQIILRPLVTEKGMYRPAS